MTEPAELVRLTHLTLRSLNYVHITREYLSLLLEVLTQPQLARDGFIAGYNGGTRNASSTDPKARPSKRSPSCMAYGIPITLAANMHHQPNSFLATFVPTPIQHTAYPLSAMTTNRSVEPFHFSHWNNQDSLGPKRG